MGDAQGPHRQQNFDGREILQLQSCCRRCDNPFIVHLPHGRRKSLRGELHDQAVEGETKLLIYTQCILFMFIVTKRRKSLCGVNPLSQPTGWLGESHLAGNRAWAGLGMTIIIIYTFNTCTMIQNVSKLG
jgi:hypothetical protein